MFCTGKSEPPDIRKKNPVQETGVKNSKNDHISVSDKLVLCQEKVQVKRGLFTFSESMKSYSAIFRNHVFQIIQFG